MNGINLVFRDPVGTEHRPINRRCKCEACLRYHEQRSNKYQYCSPPSGRTYKSQMCSGSETLSFRSSLICGCSRTAQALVLGTKIWRFESSHPHQLHESAKSSHLECDAYDSINKLQKRGYANRLIGVSVPEAHLNKNSGYRSFLMELILWQSVLLSMVSIM